MRFRRECPTCRVSQEARFDEIPRNWNLERVIDAFIRKSEAAIPQEVKEMISRAEKVKKEAQELKERYIFPSQSLMFEFLSKPLNCFIPSVGTIIRNIQPDS